MFGTFSVIDPSPFRPEAAPFSSPVLFIQACSGLRLADESLFDLFFCVYPALLAALALLSLSLSLSRELLLCSSASKTCEALTS
jgi:hypothetical protein